MSIKTTKENPWRRFASYAAIAAGGVAVYLFLSDQDLTPANLRGTSVYKDVDVSAISLRDFDNQQRQLQEFDEQWVALFFGYTHCPDVCPTTMAYLNKEYAELRELRKYVQVIMVSVDPKRDTPADLKAYVQNFNQDFLGLTGEEAALKSMVKEFGGFYHYHESDSALGYLVDHPGDIFLISPSGEWVALYRPPLRTGDLSEDLRNLILKG